MKSLIIAVLFSAALLAQIPANGPVVDLTRAVPASGWSWDNQNSAAETLGLRGERSVFQVNSGGINARLRSLVNTSGFVVTLGLSCQTDNINSTSDLRCWAGLSNGTKWMTLYTFAGYDSVGAVGLDLWTNSSTFSSTPFNYTSNKKAYLLAGPNVVYIRFVDAGGAISVSWSHDDVGFTPLYVASRTAFFSGGATKVGFGTLVNTASTFGVSADLVSYEETSPIAAAQTYVLSSFEGISAIDNLNIFSSGDGVSWGLLNAQTSYTAGAVRDPSVAKFGSTYQLVHTCTDSSGSLHRWCRSSSTDLLNWATLQAIDTSALSDSISTFAPEWVKNPDGTPYVDGSGCPHVFLVGSADSSHFDLYETHPTTCADVTAGWSTPSGPITISGESNQRLDPFVVCMNGSGGTCTGSGDTFYLWYVSIVLSTTQYIQYASSSTITGTYTLVSAGGNWAGWGGPNEEGPMLIKLSDRWRIYFDRVPATPGDIVNGQINYSDSFDSWATWSSPSPISSGIIQAKHGTVILR